MNTLHLAITYTLDDVLRIGGMVVALIIGIKILRRREKERQQDAAERREEAKRRRQEREAGEAER